MKICPLAVLTALLLPIQAGAQLAPTLQMIMTNGNNISLSWSGGSGNFSLQTTTNLVPKAIWTVQDPLLAGTGSETWSDVPPQPQQFFRLAPITPLFQFAIFYNVNLEIDPGGVMTITAPVFCNQNIWEGSYSCTFESTVAAAGTNSAQLLDPFASNFNGAPAPTFTVAGQPTSHAPPLSLAYLGTNYSPAAMLSMLELPPAAGAMGTAAAYSPTGQIYLANAADLVITNFASGTNSGSRLPTGTNLIVYYQDYSLAQLPYDYYMITNANLHTTFVTNYVSPALLGPKTNIYYAGFSWVTNVVFYDWREGWNGGSGPPKTVQAVQIDMSLFNKWLTNSATNGGASSDALKLLHTGHHIESVYVYTSVPLTTSQLPAVRVMDGLELPEPGGSTGGFTVATPFPLYVWGDYNAMDSTGSSLGTTNTTHTVPAALMGDALTILSDNWNDNVTTKLPTPSSTTVNAAMIAGIVPSNPAISGNYSGGMENFMRLLENWGGTLTYNGSMVALFSSQYATNTWLPTGNYYNAPTRHWAFDSNFANFSKLPPLTPLVENYVSP